MCLTRKDKGCVIHKGVCRSSINDHSPVCQNVSEIWLGSIFWLVETAVTQRDSQLTRNECVFACVVMCVAEKYCGNDITGPGSLKASGIRDKLQFVGERKMGREEVFWKWLTP